MVMTDQEDLTLWQQLKVDLLELHIAARLPPSGHALVLPKDDCRE